MNRISSNDISSTELIMKKLKMRKDAINEQNDKNTSSGGAKKKINLTTYMIRIANAKTPNQVFGLIRQAQSEARFLRSKGATSQETKAALGVVGKIKEKGNTKISRLRREERLQQLCDLHKNSKNQAKAEEISKTLSQKKRARKAAERIDVIHSLKHKDWDDEHSQINHQANSSFSNDHFAVSAEIGGMEHMLMDSVSDSDSIDFLL